MATLTITVPDDVAQTIAALPDANRAAYLADVNAFAVAWVSHAGKKAPMADTNGGQANGNGHAPDATETSHGFLLDPSEDTTPFTEADADADALREAYADFDADDRGKPAAQSFALVAARLGIVGVTF